MRETTSVSTQWSWTLASSLDSPRQPCVLIWRRLQPGRFLARPATARRSAGGRGAGTEASGAAPVATSLRQARRAACGLPPVHRANKRRGMPVAKRRYLTFWAASIKTSLQLVEDTSPRGRFRTPPSNSCPFLQTNSIRPSFCFKPTKSSLQTRSASCPIESCMCPATAAPRAPNLGKASPANQQSHSPILQADQAPWLAFLADPRCSPSGTVSASSRAAPNKNGEGEKEGEGPGRNNNTDSRTTGGLKA